MNAPERIAPPGGGSRLLIIVPAYNEAATIRRVVRALRAMRRPCDVLVVNDGSDDRTGEIARAAGARVLEMACNLGVGGAMQAGYQYARQQGYDLAVQFDGDGQHRASQIEGILEPVLAGRAEMAVGSRYLGRLKYRFPPSRFLGSKLLAWLVGVLLRRRITDPTSGFRAIGRSGIRFFSLHYPQAWLGDTVEALVELARHGMAVEEVPVKMARRRKGASSVSAVAGFFHTLRIILAVLIDCIERKFDDETDEGEK